MPDILRTGGRTGSAGDVQKIRAGSGAESEGGNMNQGCHRISEEAYLADPCEFPSLSRGTIKNLVMSCPARAWANHPKLNPNYKPVFKEVFDLGHAAHALFLQGIDNAWIIDAPDWRTKEAKEARTRAREADKYPLLIEQYQNVKAMVEVANEQLWNRLGMTIADGESEVAYIWKEGNIWMRIRLDWINRKERLILDYKTTGSSSNPEEYSNIAGNTGLDIQDAFYRRGVFAVESLDCDFIFMVQECQPPYICSFIRLDEMFKDMGEQKVAKGIRLWEKCLKANHWPGYTEQVYTIEAKPWALSSWEQRQANL
jgi:hypothetical protein